MQQCVSSRLSDGIAVLDSPLITGAGNGGQGGRGGDIGSHNIVGWFFIRLYLKKITHYWVLWNS